MLTMVMYHYVRDLPRTRYPRIKGLTIERFEGQLDYLEKHYTNVSLAQVVAARRGERPLPANACLLTFDDGLSDHFTFVFPRLDARGLTGSFFPPARAITGDCVLDTHKVHFILAATEDPRMLVQRVFDLLKPHRADHDLPSDEALYSTYATASRFDPAEVIFIKRILQRGLPEELRQAVTAELFASQVSADEAAFARELYLDLSQLSTMARHGMEIGGHGNRHDWLDSLTPDEQQGEIDATVALLTGILGRPPVDWTMSYPFGGYNQTTLQIIQSAGCALGLTSKVALVADLATPFELPRLDTNDLPHSGEAPLSEWTAQAHAAPAAN